MKKLAAIFLLASLCTAQAAPIAGTFSDPAMESRARDLQRQLRCLVCQGESIDESSAPLAADLRALVREQMAAGKSNRQIQDYLVARYGNFVLMKPPVQPNTYLLWLAPFLVLAGAGGSAFWVIQKARKGARNSPET